MAAITGTDDAETLDGTEDADVIKGLGGDDTLNGLGGNDSLDGGAGADAMTGGVGDDWYFVDNALDTVIEVVGEGTADRVFASVSYTLGAGVQVERLTTANNAGIGAIDLTGNGFGNIIYGNAGANVLDGGTGADILVGFAGDDTYVVDNALDRVTEGAAEGANDGILASVSYTIGTGVYVEWLATTDDAGTAAINLSGNAFVSSIRGNAGSNILDGRGGADTMTGLGGDDWYYVDNAGDVVVEAVGGGNDRISASVSYTLGAGVQVERLTTNNNLAYIDLTGNELDNLIYGNVQNNRLDGGTGADSMVGFAGHDEYFVDNPNDLVTEIAGDHSDRIYASVSYVLRPGVYVETLSTDNNLGTAAINLTGNELDNTLHGNAGANILDGGAGEDGLAGRDGNDWYFVDNIGDIVAEYEYGGDGDRVFAGLSYALAFGSRVEWLTTDNNAGTQAIDLTGNQYANVIYGNAGANLLDGKQGDDILTGLAGNDTLNGSFGKDSMYGGTGDDFYYVDSAGDKVFEFAGEGTGDRVFASVSYMLNDGFEIELLTTDNNAGTAAIILTGNDLANTIYGNAGANVLDGAAGADTLAGLGGDDWYYVDNALDKVTEGAGEGTADRIFASVSYTLGAGVEVERLTTADNNSTTAIALTGNELANLIYGNAGANVLDGKGGADSLTGFGGADVFAFTTALGAGNVDYIGDFSVADDTIHLDDAVFTGLAAGALAASAFNTGAAATEADDRIIHDSATGALLFDSDGAGGIDAVQFATLAAGLPLTAGDFLVV